MVRGSPQSLLEGTERLSSLVDFFYRFSLGKHGDEDGGGGVVSAKKVLEHRATTAEIMALMSDLQVLGRSEFKALLRW